MVSRYEVKMMDIAEILDSAQFVVDQQGHRTAAVLDIKNWQALVQLTKPEMPPPIETLETVWADSFWPEDESVDDFLATVQQWRQEDLGLHREIL
jgi:hypothetical protein